MESRVMQQQEMKTRKRKERETVKKKIEQGSG